MERNRLLN
jgi:hypothetical protein